MFIYRREPIIPVEVSDPDPAYAQLLLKQFGGPTGELTAALQYWIQSFHCKDAFVREVLQEIALEELSHLEVIGELIEQHTRDLQACNGAMLQDRLFAQFGTGPHFIDDSGLHWTSSYINECEDIVRDLRLDVAAEVAAKQAYEKLLGQTNDTGTKKVLQYLLDREASHMKMFLKALDYLERQSILAQIPDFDHARTEANMKVYTLSQEDLPKPAARRDETDSLFEVAS
jgi:Mn-containing catalase